MTTISVGGLSETLPARLNKACFLEYSNAFKNAENAMKLLLEICASPSFETMENWNKSYEKNGEKVYSKQFDIGKIFTLKIIFNETVQNLFYEHWDKITTTPLWNPNFTYMERIEKLTSHCDILKFATTDIMFMKGREFLACRLYRKIGSIIYIAARSFEINEIPEMKGKIRYLNLIISETVRIKSYHSGNSADMLLGAGRFSPHSPDPQKTLIDYAFCVNPKINLPQRLIDTFIAYTIHRDSVFARKNVRKLREGNHSLESPRIFQDFQD
uniref:START domain-containing protein n=1 Tax=Onchocerca volvulus TaxID=6282 RepID=A0A8R1U0G9_ONCVO